MMEEKLNEIKFKSFSILSFLKFIREIEGTIEMVFRFIPILPRDVRNIQSVHNV